ncbi:MAG: FAD:protein FMN transferase [Lutibacter sp.]|uniref:FAD:protein FMN transferase n=1 Tax=Lutibacter sp. TaxID=1925666 RepID=UPI001851F9D0|nr:FAD:protein FMN transferase [Lutibacter sp.]MBT8318163.1 FAD:protein FMN transferase [Lutibacter sp.]NNJ59023.1 FAD:protein FMN transferase [Lutibacter sp.]
MKNLLYIFLVVLLFSCQTQQKELKVISGNAIGTTFSIKYLTHDEIDFQPKIDSLIDAVNASVSTYIPTSDISLINKGDTSIVVDHFFEEVYFKSERIYKETDGEFDPTVGVLVNAWGFGPEKGLNNLDSVQVKELLTYVGFNKVKLENHKIIKLYPEIYFDFNAIAKGYLVDIVGRLFEYYNIENYLVEIGGEIRAKGVNQKGEFWRIGIENPNEDGTRSFATAIQLKNESMATSGNYRKFRITDSGEKFVHTINTKTGYATESNLLSASVITAFDCADADGYATALMAMGLEKSKQFLKNHPELKAYLIYVNENLEIQTYKSDNFKD